MQKETNKNVSDFIPKIIVPRIDGSMISEIKKLTKEDDEYDFSVYSYDPDDEHINAVVEGWKAEKLVKPYIEDHGPIREARKYYIVADGRFVMQELKIPPPDSGKVWDVVNINLTDNFFCVIDENVTINDGIERVNKWRGRIIVDGGSPFEKTYKFDEISSNFVNPSDFGKVLLDSGGAEVVFENQKLQMIRVAMQKTSQPISRNISQNFGMDGKGTYRSQSSVITKSGIVDCGIDKVDLTGRGLASNLDIGKISDGDFKKVGKHIINELFYLHSRYVIDSLLGLTFLAPFTSQMLEAKGGSNDRIGLWLTGVTGCGKSYTSLLFQNFFGDFSGEKSVESWSSTANSLQNVGYYYRDAIYMIDDYKNALFTESTKRGILMILQNYTDGRSRSRLTVDIQERRGKPIRGSLLITGEDMPQEYASTMGRYHIVQMDREGMNEKNLNKAYEMMNKYSGFMGRYIMWALSKPDFVDKVVSMISVYAKKFKGDTDAINIERVAQSFAYNLVGFEMFCRFLRENRFIPEKKMEEMIKTHENNLKFYIESHTTIVQESTLSEVFLSTIADLIASRSVRIHRKGFDPDPGEDKSSVVYVGFDLGDEFVYLYPAIAWKAANDALGGKLMMSHSRPALLDELVKSGAMKMGDKTHKAGQKRDWDSDLCEWSKQKRVWFIRKDRVGMDGDVMVRDQLVGDKAISEMGDLDEFDGDW